MDATWAEPLRMRRVTANLLRVVAILGHRSLDIQRGKDVERLTLEGQERPGSAWIKSSLSFSNSNCVEVANLSEGEIGVRDSKDTEGPVLRFTPDEWDAFVGGVRNGEFDSFGKA
jgi:hypothetical protein